MASAIALVILAFILIFGGIFLDIYGIFHQWNMSVIFPVFLICLAVGGTLTVIGAVMLGRSYGSRKMAEAMKMRQAYAFVRQCPYCGREIPADSVMCPYCGGKLQK